MGDQMNLLSDTMDLPPNLDIFDYCWVSSHPWTNHKAVKP